MALAYFDCFAGAAGDMIVGALIDAGADFEVVKSSLAKMKLPDCSVRAEKVRRGGITGTLFRVDTGRTDHSHRSLGEILTMIRGAGLAARTADRAERVFQRLGLAEAKVHDVLVEQVHFHEVGAIDSIADVVSACAAMESLDIDRVVCSAIPVGGGTVVCDHGVLPVPAPATVELLVGAKVAPSETPAELTTPTGAAVLTTLSESYGPLPAMTVDAVGYGAGTRTGGELPNLLRLVVGTPDETGTADTVVELSANLDDCTGEVIGATIAKLLAAGCLDAWATPAVMKKNRPGWVLSALCSLGDVRKIERIIFTETTTFGVRRCTSARSKLRRGFETVETPYGPVRVKIGRCEDKVVTASPEFDDCLRAAEAHHVPVKEVMLAAESIYRQGERS